AGAAPQAVAFLKKALELAGSADWSGRTEAEADLGIAQIMAGDAANGLNNLHAAQQHFQAASNTAMLKTCLENEAAYWKRAGKTREAEQVLARLQSVEPKSP